MSSFRFTNIFQCHIVSVSCCQVTFHPGAGLSSSCWPASSCCSPTDSAGLGALNAYVSLEEKALATSLGEGGAEVAWGPWAGLGAGGVGPDLGVSGGGGLGVGVVVAVVQPRI